MLFADSPEVILRETRDDPSVIFAILFIGLLGGFLAALHHFLVQVPREARLKLAAEQTEQERQRTEQAKILAEVEKQQTQRESASGSKRNRKTEADECDLGGEG